jgi:hypothetical protein
MSDPASGAETLERTTTSPITGEGAAEGDHERMSHIVLEGFRPSEDEFVPAGPSVAEGIINGSPVRALCGKTWVPNRDPKRYPLCSTCKEIALKMGWDVPIS